jgi:hypothetical protein
MSSVNKIINTDYIKRILDDYLYIYKNQCIINSLPSHIYDEIFLLYNSDDGFNLYEIKKILLAYKYYNSNRVEIIHKYFYFINYQYYPLTEIIRKCKLLVNPTYFKVREIVRQYFSRNNKEIDKYIPMVIYELTKHTRFPFKGLTIKERDLIIQHTPDHIGTTYIEWIFEIGLKLNIPTIHFLVYGYFKPIDPLITICVKFVNKNVKNKKLLLKEIPNDVYILLE